MTNVPIGTNTEKNIIKRREFCENIIHPTILGEIVLYQDYPNINLFSDATMAAVERQRELIFYYLTMKDLIFTWVRCKDIHLDFYVLKVIAVTLKMNCIEIFSWYDAIINRKGISMAHYCDCYRQHSVTLSYWTQYQ